MNAREFLEILHVAEKLKDTPRHCTTSKRRIESVAEHSWRVSLMAFLLKDEFPEVDTDKVVCMCLIHDLGECFTGDIPTFVKTDSDRKTEDELLGEWVKSLPEEVSKSMVELYDEMDGFTLYHDNLSKYGQTFPAVANLLTGREYGREGRYLYLTNSFAGRNPLDELRDNGFVSNFLTECPNAFNNIVNLNDHCDNIKESEMECCIDYYSDYGIIYTMTLLSFSKCLPYFMKCLATESIEPDFTNFFVYLKDENGKVEVEDMMHYNVSPDCDLKYYKYMSSHPLDSNCENKVFNFIHFAGFHDDSREVSELYEGYDGGRVDYYTTARGEFEIINNYMEQMKKLGVYDNSTIIILGDHGKQIASVTKGNKQVEPITTGLMIKPENSHGRMQDDYTSQLSHKYFQASVLEYAGIDHSNYGYSYNDIIDGNIRQKFKKGS